ncbi:MAG: hypothetical protein R6X18_08315 [Chloroflexota bacterium]|jgi:hypothetical protein
MTAGVPSTIPLPDESRTQSSPGGRGSWAESLLAGMPPVLMSLLAASGSFLIAIGFEVEQAVIVAAGLALASLVVGVLFVAGRRGWPRWGASWYAYGLWVGAMIGFLVFELLHIPESWRFTNWILPGLLLILLLIYFHLLVFDRLKALLAIAYFLPLLGVTFLEFVPDMTEAVVTVIIGILAGAGAAFSLRSGRVRIAVGLAIIVNLLAGLLIAFTAEYLATDLPPGSPAPFMTDPQFFIRLALSYWGISLGLILIPFFVWFLSRGIIRSGEGTINPR